MLIMNYNNVNIIVCVFLKPSMDVADCIYCSKTWFIKIKYIRRFYPCGKSVTNCLERIIIAIWNILYMVSLVWGTLAWYPIYALVSTVSSVCITKISHRLSLHKIPIKSRQWPVAKRYWTINQLCVFGPIVDNGCKLLFFNTTWHHICPVLYTLQHTRTLVSFDLINGGEITRSKCPWETLNTLRPKQITDISQTTFSNEWRCVDFD